MSTTTTLDRKKLGGAAAVLAASSIGTLFAAFGALWVAGSLGISTAAASQIVAAIAAGGWALRAVIIVFGAGVIGAIAATVMWFITTKGKGAAIA
ncbi:hypothetical protein AS188_01450 [Kocuria flava]|uniref:Circular bacteriocin, circularin A/uberolysin family n=1 Tax=Kocuria flava TaxID=446860 RepID=A0A0U3HCX9_9MICC|nr:MULTISPECIES: hypothetical protein [Kocuria]ALU38632.1 hypothetical protein AS188_01450 [Kocuria flava]MCD1145296.1 hypothetical protein [Kocuria sp. LUK]PLC11804.1 hypothetical protein AUQ48_05590 [Kocuria flava]GEO91677.1 hypothetical protein KFL01_09830 [Kocuria flava]